MERKLFEVWVTDNTKVAVFDERGVEIGSGNIEPFYPPSFQFIGEAIRIAVTPSVRYAE